ncbi:helix-turn-helix domain-containing protein [Paraburkholderia sp. RP-4-7]|uniref:Helix-turn-helix domain-containing protein n=1 Tax=Paraburkholderia polaris TaxID=2728848 RepID=A0A848IRJ8_9BURK|nr:helix-turn-helix domain-containing protein [Paraburkholderia polaris]NMM04321.1 helix-turn-helix domain-containing protein [Paraburkholderia polaris]
MILLFESFSLVQVGRLAETFSLANRRRHPENALHNNYYLRLVSASGGAICSSSSVSIWTDAVDARYGKDVHALFVLGGASASVEIDERLLLWVRHAYLHAQVVQGIGGGHGALEMAGLEPKDVGVTGLAGGAMPPCALSAARKAGIDADAGVALTSALSLVRRDCGYETASQITHDRLPVTPKQFTHSALDSREARASDPIRMSAHHLRVSCGNCVSIADTARAAAMSERNFLRRFKQEIGMTPTEFILRVRLQKACAMLVDTNLPVDKIARRTGFGSGARLSKLFRQHLAMPPTEYRTIERSRVVECRFH